MKAGAALQGSWCLSRIANSFPLTVLGCLYSLYHKLEARPHLTEPKNGPFVAVFIPLVSSLMVAWATGVHPFSVGYGPQEGSAPARACYFYRTVT